MTPWWREPAAIFDLETTGVNTRTDRVVSWCVGGVGHPLDSSLQPRVQAELVNPGVPIPAGASAVHGIFDQHVRSTGNPPRESLARAVELLANAVKVGIPIMGMNLAYDFSLLHFECLRHGLPTVEQVAGHPLAPVLDAYVLDQRVDRYRAGSRKLAAIAGHYGVTLENAHDAVADAIASADVVYAIAERYPAIGNTGLYLLHLNQVEWKAEQAAGLQAYKRRTDPSKVIDPCWPYCVNPQHTSG
ncbi:MAG TPA: exonuclease domain-containing protein [Kofleriaceae bacterium]